MAEAETEEKSTAVDLYRDLEWAYQFMDKAKTEEDPEPPSRAASALLKLARKDPDKFLGRFIQFKQKKDAGLDEADKSLKEDRHETMLALKRLEQAIEPDIANVLREANEQFPELFGRVITELGWSRT